MKQLANACVYVSCLPVTDLWVAARCTRRNKRANMTENIFGYGLKYGESLWVGSYMLVPSSPFLLNLSAISKSQYVQSEFPSLSVDQSEINFLFPVYTERLLLFNVMTSDSISGPRACYLSSLLAAGKTRIGNTITPSTRLLSQ